MCRASYTTTGGSSGPPASMQLLRYSPTVSGRGGTWGILGTGTASKGSRGRLGAKVPHAVSSQRRRAQGEPVPRVSLGGVDRVHTVFALGNGSHFGGRTSTSTTAPCVSIACTPRALSAPIRRTRSVRGAIASCGGRRTAGATGRDGWNRPRLPGGRRQLRRATRLATARVEAGNRRSRRAVQKALRPSPIRMRTSASAKGSART